MIDNLVRDVIRAEDKANVALALLGFRYGKNKKR